MVSAQKRGFEEEFSDGVPDRIVMKMTIGSKGYNVACDVDPQGEENTALFDDIECSGGASFPGTLGTNAITNIIAALEFADEFAEEYGYDFRGPAVGPSAD